MVSPSRVNPRLSFVPPTRIRQTRSLWKSTWLYCWSLSPLTMTTGSVPPTMTRSSTSPMNGATSSKDSGRGRSSSHCRAAETTAKSSSKSLRSASFDAGDPYPACCHRRRIRSPSSACSVCLTDSCTSIVWWRKALSSEGLLVALHSLIAPVSTKAFRASRSSSSTRCGSVSSSPCRLRTKAFSFETAGSSFSSSVSSSKS